MLDLDAVSVAERFGLESGVAIAQELFETVDVRCYPDGLHITEVGPLLDYLRSVPGVGDEGELARVQAEVEREVARSGAFLIGKDAG